MPVEIRELHIRAVVTSEPRQGRQTPTPAGSTHSQDREALTAEIVAGVMEALRQKAER